MKNTLFALLAIAASLTSIPAVAQTDGEWVGIGKGAYQPGLLDCYSDEYPEVMEAAVYESSERPGVYRFVPTAPAAGALVVYDVVVHAENPDKVWCENSTYFRGIMNFNTCQKVKETSSYDIEANYGKMADGKISFATPESFLAMTMTGYLTTNLNGNFALYLPGSAPGDDPCANDTWEVMGTGKYVEGLLDCEYTPGIVWDVEIERSLDTPGCYRLKPYFAGNPSCPNLPEIADTYVYVHAEDEMEVYTSDFILLNNQGKGYKIQHRAVLESNPDPAYYGIMEDGIITFPANSHYADVIGVPGMGRQLTNTSGKACIALPGADYKDYWIKAEHPVCTTNGGDHFCNFPFTLYGGADVVAAVVAVEAGNVTLDEINPEVYVSSGTQFPAAFFKFQFNMNFPLVADEFNTNRWSLITIALDKKGNAQNTVITTFFTPQDDTEWEDYATAEFTDLLLGPAYTATNEISTVTVQRKKGTQGTLRIVNPYAGHPVFSNSDQYYTGHTDHSHYLYIHAEDPEYVYIEEAPVGLNLGYGDVVASSAVGAQLNKRLTIDQVKATGVAAGRLEGDNIIFPAYSLYFFETEYKDNLLQEGGEGVLLHITEYLAGIDDVNVDTVPAVYYDLRGIRVANPQPGGIYIRVTGDTATKVRL